ncbi:PepSY domain-containing protein [Caenispirillum salinarum]|uniref:PepSY domain-containing protein n=1 Tax=Caenispirillum salinarum TaxID=859058 RepID=UPI00384DA10C
MRTPLSAMLAAAGLLAAAAVPAAAADADEMLEFITTNQVMPMAKAIDGIAGAHPGTVVEVELEEEDDSPSGWAYEIDVLTAEGDVVEVEVDAVSGKIADVDQ